MSIRQSVIRTVRKPAILAAGLLSLALVSPALGQNGSQYYGPYGSRYYGQSHTYGPSEEVIVTPGARVLRSETVRYDDLNLSRVNDIIVFRHRVRGAASDVCNGLVDYPLATAAWSDCFGNAVNRADPQVTSIIQNYPVTDWTMTP